MTPPNPSDYFDLGCAGLDRNDYINRFIRFAFPWRKTGWSMCWSETFQAWGVPLATDGQRVLWFAGRSCTVVVTKANLIGPVEVWDTDPEDWNYERNTRKVLVLRRKAGDPRPPIILPVHSFIDHLTKEDLESDAVFWNAKVNFRGETVDFFKVHAELCERYPTSEAGPRTASRSSSSPRSPKPPCLAMSLLMASGAGK